MRVEYAETLLEVQNVCLEYKGKVILKNVNAEIKNIVGHGQVVGFLGPSGIGKTQLFRIIAGLNQPTSGQVVLNGLKRPVRPGEVGVVAQSYPLFEHRTVYSNLMLAACRTEKNKKAAEERVRALADEFDLTNRLAAYPVGDQLSGGQRQRCAILQQILCSEHFILMDEPFSGLDMLMLEKTSALISKIVGLHDLNTVIVVTHDITAAAAVADHLWLMGRDSGPDGKKLPGARIVETYDLVERDLCWQKDIITQPRFMEFVREVKQEFRNL